MRVVTKGTDSCGLSAPCRRRTLWACRFSALHSRLSRTSIRLAHLVSRMASLLGTSRFFFRSHIIKVMWSHISKLNVACVAQMTTMTAWPAIQDSKWCCLACISEGPGPGHSTASTETQLLDIPLIRTFDAAPFDQSPHPTCPPAHSLPSSLAFIRVWPRHGPHRITLEI